MNSETELWEALARYISGEASPDETARVRAWLAAEPGRAELLSRLEASLQQLPDSAAADVDVESALAAVKSRFAEARVYELAPRRSNRHLLRAAAAAVVLVGGSLIWKAAQDSERGPALAAAQYYETGVAETDSLRLPDGTRVVLAPGTRLTLAAGYGSKARVVELNGEALFDVQHDDARPFSVRTGTAIIRDIGTTFTVRNVAGLNVEVAVTAGSVVLHAGTDDESKGVVLQAGDLGVFDRSGVANVYVGAVSDADTAFVSGRLVFREASLNEVAAELKRWYGIELLVEDRTLAARHITASFHGESKEQVLNVLGLALGVQIELNGDTAVIDSR